MIDNLDDHDYLPREYLATLPTPEQAFKRRVTFWCVVGAILTAISAACCQGSLS